MNEVVVRERALDKGAQDRLHGDGEPLDDPLQREKLFDRLLKIVRSISHGAPLQEVLDAITAGASELLGDEVVGLRLTDESDPTHSILVSAGGMRDDLVELLRHTPIDQGAGGRAIREDGLVVMHDYAKDPGALGALVEEGLQAAMAAPVHEHGRVVGSLTVGSYEPGRRYSTSEQDALCAFAQYASLALTDAKKVEAMREAERAKEMFFATASHELKTPLTVILGTLRTLKRHHGTMERELLEDMITSAQERGEELESLINSLLQGARAELARDKYDVFLPDLVTTAVKGFDQSRSLQIADIPAVDVKVDAGAVKEILGILTENAVAHSPPLSEISIDARVSEGEVSLTVRNRGSLPEELDEGNLFEAFRRGDDVQTSGVGLGLYIALRLARSLDGTIEARSSEGSVEFTLRFPFDAPGRRVPEQTSFEVH